VSQFSFIFLSFGAKPRREFRVGGKPFLGYHDPVAILISSVVHPIRVYCLGFIQMH
jgi:hypothetical protein